MSAYEILCLLGVPGLLAAVIGFFIKITKQSKADGPPIYAKENFENCWKQYHGLGANGVMDDIHEKFLDLPDREI